MTFLLYALGTAAALATAGLLYQAVGSRLDAIRRPAPGKFVNASTGPIHVYRAGSGTPAVVFEAGIAATSLNWRVVQSGVARFTSTYSYDRAGLGWSRRARVAKDLPAMAEGLRSALAAAGVQRPVILAAHSFGAAIALQYAAAYPKELQGIVLVDPVSLAEWCSMTAEQRRRLDRGVLLSRRGAVLARLGIVRFALALAVLGSRRLPKLIAKASSGRASAVTERLAGEVRKMPPELWPMVQAHWSNPTSFQAMAEYLDALPECAAAAQRLQGCSDIPMVVVSGAHLTAKQLEEHAELARKYCAEHITVEGAGHWIQLDRPEAVVGAIRRLVQAAEA